ncbi:MAG TPA: hypothetical protein VHX12_01915 [Acidisoma sp.]|jgi:hypothetical protein|nr:hypothetical protein [Acidisoma sp.]
MKRSLAGLVVLMSAVASAHAAQSTTRFEDWRATSQVQNGRPICYSFTQAILRRGVKGGCNSAVLVVTHAPPKHDRVVVSPCHPYAPGQSALRMAVGTTRLGFHAHGHYAYADAAPAAVRAFRRGFEASIPASGRHPRELFSLRGFSKAYDAMRAQCIG